MLRSGGRSGGKNGASLRGAVHVLAEPPPTALTLATALFIYDNPLVTLASASQAALVYRRKEHD